MISRMILEKLYVESLNLVGGHQSTINSGFLYHSINPEIFLLNVIVKKLGIFKQKS